MPIAQTVKSNIIDVLSCGVTQYDCIAETVSEDIENHPTWNEAEKEKAFAVLAKEMDKIDSAKSVANCKNKYMKLL